MATSKPLTKTTLWVWASGLFPRRIVYYLRAKGITTATLKHHNIHLIPVEVNSTGLHALPDYEPRPPNRSLPSLRIQHENGTEFWISETAAILEYFEDLFPSSKGHPDLTGNTMEQRARTRDILNLLAETNIWYVVWLINTVPATAAWSGISAEQMSATTGEHAGKKVHALLSRLEMWVEQDVVVDGVKSLTGKGLGVTLADVVLMAHVEYALMMYEIDAVAEHGVLRIWCERVKKEKWLIKSEDLKKVDQGGTWESVLG